ncbi:MAG: AI-2E family transporter [Lachnospiraceae bacterium]|nr:AI-2E family transporter [Lachnospiraceae bacterium]
MDEKRTNRFKILFVLVITLILFLIIYMIFGKINVSSVISNFSRILMPLIYGCVIAYLLKPLCNWFDNFFNKLYHDRMHGKKDINVAPISIFISMTFGLLSIWLIMSMVIPQLADSVIKLFRQLPGITDEVTSWIQTHIAENTTTQKYMEELTADLTYNLQSWLKNTMIPNMQMVVSGFSNGIFSIFIIFKNLIIGIIAAIYLLAGRKKLSYQAKMILYGMIPQKYADIIFNEVKYADKMFEGFLSGKILDSAIIGIICYIFTLIFNMPYAVLVSVIVGITNIIPFFGPYIGAVPSIFIILIADPVKAIEFLVFIIILQQFDGNILGPKILGNATGLSSFWVLFAIILFGGLWGFAGMIIGVPLFAVIYDIIRKLVKSGLSNRNHDEMITYYEEEFKKSNTPQQADGASNL